MPANGDLDMKATTNNSDVYGSRILVQVTVSQPSYTISGTLYSDEGSTQITAGSKSIVAKVNGLGTFSTTTTSGTGAWHIDGLTYQIGNPIAIWVDADAALRAFTITKPSAIADISGLDLYQNRVIIRP